METEPDHCNGNTYIITHDLGERIRGLRLLGLRTPDSNDSFFSEFHQKIKNAITSMLPEISVITYDMRELVEEVWTEALRLQRNLKDAIVVSSCAEVASPRRGHTIEINRIVDVNGDIIGLGPRPANPPLKNQVQGIAAMADGNPVVLVEDGAFTGTTIEFLLDSLRSGKVNVAAIVVGLCFPGAVKRIKEVFKGELVVMKEINKPYEWMPDHDFVPFVPNCGRVFGGPFGSDFLPFYTHDGLSYCFPYVLPFGDPVKWASIPSEHAGLFSLLCLEETLALFRMLDDMNGRQITPLDLIGTTPRASVPMSKGNGQLPDADVPISSFLSEVCHELS